ncbi:MAG: hypothetical protein GOMPHAMPRED_008121 [Gomphillus americanus]|uniref:Ribosomal RNA-processing protein 43 n=1 Tax=Gomphillus americanus TaxID=1940652 RepID=A0A8H3IFU9_9LECA|nr:MAG: hypothetical protein GOMPHAMPRED_008121 [Gomphillus americanus]
MTIQLSSSESGTSPSLSLSLPPSTYAKLLPLSFLAAHLPETRPSGRSPSEFRQTTLHTGSLTHAHGSAVVRIGDTAVVCGVRGEILRASDTNIPDDFSGDDSERISTLGLLIPNVELSTGCNPAFLPGNAPGSTAQGLLQRLITLLKVGSVVGFEELCIYEDRSELIASDDKMQDEPEKREVRAYFTLYIDILFLSLSGSAFDTAWMALLAALKDTKLPTARWDRDSEGALCDPRPENYKKLRVQRFPVALSWAVFSETKSKLNVVLVDADDFEESCCDEGGLIVMDIDQTTGQELLLRVEKYGGGVVAIAEMKTILSIASKRWKEWDALLKGR